MIFFLFFIEIMCCGPSSGPSHQDGSDGSQHMFLGRGNKNYPLHVTGTPAYLQLWFKF